MKILGRTLIILAVFFIFSGLMVAVVNMSGANTPDYGGELPPIRPTNAGDQAQPEGSEFRPERGERGESGGPRWLFGLIKNVGVMAVLVAIIVIPKSITKKKRKQGATNV